MSDPFFIIGAPRSGTTYVQYMLRHHGQLYVTDEVRIMLARKYLEVFERLTGETFTSEVGSVATRIERNLKAKGYL